jgi:heat-inducible transcriptional repressor
MNELTERQQLILSLVIHEHVRNASPVGSKTLVDNYQLNMSSATVRNEMATLTEYGYLRQPHTSAGREPSEEGYRYFVRNLLQNTELPAGTRSMITHQFYQSRQEMDEWMRLTASILAQQSKAASLVTAPHPQQIQLKHLELISIQGRQVLMVLVMFGGEVYQRMLTTEGPVPQEQLSETSRRLNQMVQGKSINEMMNLRKKVFNLEGTVMDWVVKEMQYIHSNVSGEVYLDGLANVLAEPEFSGSADARRAIRVLEERSLLQQLLEQALTSESVGHVEVLIGGEGNWNELSQCAVVLSRYGKPGLATGTLGVLGPIRMSYGRTISTVRFLSGLLSDLVTETILG